MLFISKSWSAWSLSLLLLSGTASADSAETETVSRPAAQTFTLTSIQLGEALSPDLSVGTPAARFKSDTARIYCSFSWAGAGAGDTLNARWHYLDENIHILNFPIPLEQASGSGATSLSMPAGKKFPSGYYRVELSCKSKPVGSAVFLIEPDGTSTSESPATS